MSCLIPKCDRDAEVEFCDLHLLAKEELEKAFLAWKKAYGDNFTREEYLTRLNEDKEINVGLLVIDLVLFELDIDPNLK